MSTMQPEQAALTKDFEVQSGDFSAAGAASAGIKRVLKKLGIDSAVVRRVSIASYEAELNLIIHSHGGQLVLSVTQDRVEPVSYTHLDVYKRQYPGWCPGAPCPRRRR